MAYMDYAKFRFRNKTADKPATNVQGNGHAAPAQGPITKVLLGDVPAATEKEDAANPRNEKPRYLLVQFNAGGANHSQVYDMGPAHFVGAAVGTFTFTGGKYFLACAGTKSDGKDDLPFAFDPTEV